MLSKNVDFTYDSTELFNKFTATISAGLCTALVGANGTGKSTLVSLITGLDRPSQGDVYLNNLPLLEYNTDVIAQYYGYVPKIFLFLLTLFEQISLWGEKFQIIVYMIF